MAAAAPQNILYKDMDGYVHVTSAADIETMKNQKHKKVILNQWGEFHDMNGEFPLSDCDWIFALQIDCRFKVLPKHFRGISKMTGVRMLVLRGKTHMVEIPSEIYGMNLRVLDVSDLKHIEMFPKGISKLKNLEFFTAPNRAMALPDELADLPALRYLNLGFCDIDSAVLKTMVVKGFRKHGEKFKVYTRYNRLNCHSGSGYIDIYEFMAKLHRISKR